MCAYEARKKGALGEVGKNCRTSALETVTSVSVSAAARLVEERDSGPDVWQDERTNSESHLQWAASPDR